MTHICYENKCCSCGKGKEGMFGLKDTWTTTEGHGFHQKCLKEDMLTQFIFSGKYSLLNNGDN